MAASSTFKLVIAAATLAVCVGALFVTGRLGALGDAGNTELSVDDAGPLAEDLRRPTPAHLIAGTTLDEATALELLPHLRRNPRELWDPVAIVVLKPHVDEPFPWPEHPGKAIRIVTNERGLREDGPTSLEHEGPRVLVAGDSHTSGLVNNAESFANVLERRLGVDVVNAGVGGTGPYEVEGSVRKYLELSPDVVVAVLFTGNDFSNALRFADFFAKRPMTPMAKDAASRQEAARKKWPAQMAQGWNQAFELTYRPGDEELARDATIARFVAMAETCAAGGVGFLALVLPTKADVEPLDDVRTFTGISETLQFDAEDYAINARLGHALALALREQGIEVLELQEGLSGGAGPCYWRKDHHLAVQGHARVAELIEEPVRRLLAR